MASITFHLRPSSSLETKEGSVFIRVIHDRKVAAITTPYRLFPEEWDKKKHCVVYPSDDSSRYLIIKEIAQSINRDKLILMQTVEQLEKQGFYTTADILSGYRIHKEGGMLSVYTEKLAEELIGYGQERTARAYRTVVDGFLRFNNGQDIRLEHINNLLMHRFEQSLKVRGKSLNTISFYMRNLRAIYNKAIREQCVMPKFENPFAGIYTGVQITRKRALSQKEIMKLDALDNIKKNRTEKGEKLFLNRDLDRALSFFLFCFHARGMSFVDMAYLRKENIRDGVISYFRKKTKQLVEVKVTTDMDAIIKRFAKETKDSPYVFPIIRPEKGSIRLQYESALRVQNKRLERIASLCGLKNKITTHVARHTWATIAKQANLPLMVISEGLGHSSEKTTYIYLASFDRSVLDKANDKVAKMIRASR